MPIRHAIWKVGSKPSPLANSVLVNEQQLEDMIVAAPEILSGEWMLIGRQTDTGFGGRIDLLAIAPDSSLVLVELKRDRTPREIVAQAIDYASWVEKLTAEKISQIYHKFTKGGNLYDAFKTRFGVGIDGDTLNASHQILIVAAKLDDSTERIIKYLNERDIPINVLFFQVFQNGTEQFLSRAWMIDPGETQSHVAATTNAAAEKKEPWNGEFYVSYGGDCTWEDARKYGFISGGGGAWYSRTLGMLSTGDRVWVKVPGSGFVGVGRVTGTVLPASEFQVKTDAGMKSVLEVVRNRTGGEIRSSDPEMAEYFVGVEWLDAVPQHQGIDEDGLFGNQNTVCQPTSPKWRHTVERLKSAFKNWDKKV